MTKLINKRPKLGDVVWVPRRPITNEPTQADHLEAAKAAIDAYQEATKQ